MSEAEQQEIRDRIYSAITQPKTPPKARPPTPEVVPRPPKSARQKSVETMRENARRALKERFTEAKLLDTSLRIESGGFSPKTLASIREAVRVRAKVGTGDTFSLDAIEGFINQRYFNIATETKWRWLVFQRDIQIIQKYTTGTITTLDNSRTITGAGTTWNTNEAVRAGDFIRIATDEEVFQIIGVTDDTTIELSERVNRVAGRRLARGLSGEAFDEWDNQYGDVNEWHQSDPDGLAAAIARYRDRLYRSKGLDSWR